MEAFKLSPVIATTQSVVFVDIIIFVGQEMTTITINVWKGEMKGVFLELF
jgi:hypothetical protein